MSLKPNAGLLLPILFVAQAYASFSSQSVYPLNPYRMFSRNWKDGIVMAKVSYFSAGRSYDAWEALAMPFFQANHVSFVTFLDEAPMAQRKIVCDLASKRGLALPITVLGEEIEFKRDPSGIISPRTTRSEVRHVCT